MKKLSLYIFLVLMWCNVSSSESIKDYEKGGLKLGGSLLDLMNEGELIKNKISKWK